MKEKKITKIKVNVPLRGYAVGSEIIFSENHTKLDRFWVKRIKDSTIDGCITVIDPETRSDSPMNAPEVHKLPKKVRKEHVDK